MVHGASFSEANEFALALVGPNDAYIHPSDDPLLWHGHTMLVDEMARQGPKPDVVVLSVGGGGLFCGVVEGLRRNGWGDVPVVAVETMGADSLAQSMQAGHTVTLPAINSMATSLGSRAVCAQSLRLAQEHPASRRWCRTRPPWKLAWRCWTTTACWSNPPVARCWQRCTAYPG